MSRLVVTVLFAAMALAACADKVASPSPTLPPPAGEPSPRPAFECPAGMPAYKCAQLEKLHNDPAPQR